MEIMGHTQSNCSGCQHQNRCGDLYRRLGSSQTAPVAGKVVWAFVVPLMLFIGGLALSGPVLRKVLHPDIADGVGVLPALLLVLVYALLAKRWMREPYLKHRAVQAHSE